MDLLENYKKAWVNQPEEISKFSAIEIYKLAHSKSSSIVKWIFIIGILEFIFLNSLYFFVDMDDAYAEYKKIGLENFIYFSQIVFYIIIFYFLMKFYLNYRKISTSDSTRVLMKKILKTRKTVRNYVIFNLIYIALISVIVMVAEINLNFQDFNAKQIILFCLLTLLLTTVMLAVLYLFYRLLYGILLKKLKRNYKELAKLDSAN
ncbi:hypothetical protein H9I45_01415 [Polaribacter haliotis]|uniref:Beta-carotene 15,15'-monooxygenase n=1 Tax=Polaribacter haliotis TaxID=1888915 RepID=A0A7L8AH62_9FLAO|nr:hypothetical protein [Polaribacter haliotis]QOD61129.1 hypothetical protein H9I45_01415 [Polaribacter haliotis]